jgi:uncharacterized protein
MPLSKTQHLDPAHGPKRILSLDGGGLRGIVTLQYLAVLEGTIQTRFDDKALRLCDYFDLIGGTSTGAIIAAGLACGMTVEALKQIYTGIGATAFKPTMLGAFTPDALKGLFAPKFPSEPLQRELDRQLGADTTLDSDKVLTGLMLMTKRLDTGSPWPLHNNPAARYAKQDGALLLSHIVGASTAAPTYFAPEKIVISARDGTTTPGVFVDGGVTPFNDPALQLLMLATLQGHGFHWKTGKEELLIVSIGTGVYKPSVTPEAILDSATAQQGIAALKSLMDDCDRVNRATLQWLTNCLTPWIIDRAVGDMKLDSASGPQLGAYVRYNVVFEQSWLKTELGLDLPPNRIAEIARIDDPSKLADLAAVGLEAAKRQMKPEHLPAAFDLK